MSVAVISYTSLKNAADEAKTVAKKLDNYADDLYRVVLNKLNDYNGSSAGNLVVAKSQTSAKIMDLNQKSYAYATYAEDLLDLQVECENRDQAVKTMVSQLTADFKRDHGIKNSKVINAINYFLTAIRNSSSAGRWVHHKMDQVSSVKDWIKQKIKNWWNFAGGKELIQGGIVAALEIAAGVCAIITGVGAVFAAIGAIAAIGLTIGTALGLITAVAGLITGMLTYGNGLVNLCNEGRAYHGTHCNNDPALGRRRSDENTLQETIRRESDSKEQHNFARRLDIVSAVCSVVTFLDGASKLVKNLYKWSTGSCANVKDLSLKQIFSKDSAKKFWVKIKDTAMHGWKDLKAAIRSKDITMVKDFVYDFGNDFLNNLKNTYLNFESLEDGVKTVEKITKIPKAFMEQIIDDKLTLTNVVFGIGFKEIVLPNINCGTLVTVDTNLGGKNVDFDISAMHIDDFTGTIEGFQHNKDNIIKINEGDSLIDQELFKKLSTKCNVNIQTPVVKIPAVSFGFGY